MIGAVLGDIAGSKWEFCCVDEYFTPDMKLFQNDSFFTDDTVLAAATKWAILSQISYADSYKLFYDFYRKSQHLVTFTHRISLYYSYFPIYMD